MKKAVCIILSAVFFLLCGCARAESENEGGNSNVSFYAIDGANGVALENVKVVLPEYETVLYTDFNGKTEEVCLNALYDTRSEKSLLQPYGTMTVRAYKDGYNDYALFYAQVKEYEDRCIKLYLFALDTPMGNGLPLATVESPEKEWTEQIVEKYRNFA